MTYFLLFIIGAAVFFMAMKIQKLQDDVIRLEGLRDSDLRTIAHIHEGLTEAERQLELLERTKVTKQQLRGNS